MAAAIQATLCTAEPVCAGGVSGGVCVLVMVVVSPSTSERVVYPLGTEASTTAHWCAEESPVHECAHLLESLSFTSSNTTPSRNNFTVMASGRLPSESLRSFHTLRTVRSRVGLSWVEHSVFGSMASSRDPLETPSCGMATSMLAEAHCQ